MKQIELSNGEGYLYIDDIKHWYKIGGLEHATTPIVIIHGGPSGNQYILERTIGPALETFATVVYYEQRGCGRSAKPDDPTHYSIPLLVRDLESLREQLGMERIVLLGTSFGSEIAMEYALAYPDRVEKLILQGPVDGNWERLQSVQFYGLQQVATGAVLEQIGSILQAGGSYEERRQNIWSQVDEETLLRLSLFKLENLQAAIPLIQESQQFGFNADMHTALTTRPVTLPRLLDRVTAIQTPTLILVGLHDRHTGVEMSRDLHVRIPHSKLVILMESAHYPEADEPERFCEEIQRFL